MEGDFTRRAVLEKGGKAAGLGIGAVLAGCSGDGAQNKDQEAVNTPETENTKGNNFGNERRSINSRHALLEGQAEVSTIDSLTNYLDDTEELIDLFSSGNSIGDGTGVFGIPPQEEIASSVSHIIGGGYEGRFSVTNLEGKLEEIERVAEQYYEDELPAHFRVEDSKNTVFGSLEGAEDHTTLFAATENFPNYLGADQSIIDDLFKDLVIEGNFETVADNTLFDEAPKFESMRQKYLKGEGLTESGKKRAERLRHVDTKYMLDGSVSPPSVVTSGKYGGEPITSGLTLPRPMERVRFTKEGPGGYNLIHTE